MYDLNIPWTAVTPSAELERTISFLSSLGYNTIALNHTLSSTSLPSQITNPIPLPSSFPISSKTTILRRCTLNISDPSQNPRLLAVSAAYDILALRPTTEKAFLAACLTLPEFSLISLDLTQRFPFHFRPKPLMAAVNRGIRFELCYAQATMGDAAARRNVISNCLGIIRATRGRGLVISSEAKSAVAARAPADVLNLLGVWGLGRERGLESMGVNPRAVVVNEGIKRSAFRGVVDVVFGGEIRVEKDKGQAKDGGRKAEGVDKKGKGKRKAEESNTESTPQISKRQAKRMRLEALKASKESSSLAADATTDNTAPSNDTTSPEGSATPASIQAKSNG
ncbi:Uncharacterized protein BP5553_02527 [Venustampulla echinocandica]|uniref:Uncharacterized protein n=1 Tax=Venustampulla echinocandica TaxID=2656787 RepID=A0A370U455_9HELO|nr:Uncharacterized protein BP5553_02527 [Venustampulla echinocandica]RDL42548.1 Uncharacterized protein BP5553_02527 [Venustampulla echinocandica]